MQKRIYTVGQVNTYVKGLITNDYLLRNLLIKGEVSNLKYHSSGHIYFSLKDETGSIRAVMFASSRRKGLPFQMENGQAVIAEGNVSVYERDGQYQFYAAAITLDGAGDLHARYEALKQKLYEEGLFEFDVKKPICKYPKRVGIVTAKTGAAIEDIKNIAKRRNPYVQLVLYPAKVQGDGAAETIVKGIETLDNYGVDTIIIGRGGGSIEDLWAFNEEIVARAIYRCRTPIISGTGHEIDNTIADYAADLRAPTPSAACELAIPDVMDKLRELNGYQEQMKTAITGRLSETKLLLSALERHLAGENPKHKLRNQQIYLDDLAERLKHGFSRKFEHTKHRFSVLSVRLHGLSPTSKLVGGFGYVEAAGAPVLSAEQVKQGDTLSVTVHDGVLTAEVTDILNKEDKGK